MKTYGHLGDEHGAHVAKKVTFDPLSEPDADSGNNLIKIVS